MSTPLRSRSLSWHYIHIVLVAKHVLMQNASWTVMPCINVEWNANNFSLILIPRFRFDGSINTYDSASNCVCEMALCARMRCTYTYTYRFERETTVVAISTPSKMKILRSYFRLEFCVLIRECIELLNKVTVNSCGRFEIDKSGIHLANGKWDSDRALWMGSQEDNQTAFVITWFISMLLLTTLYSGAGPWLCELMAHN